MVPESNGTKKTTDTKKYKIVIEIDNGNTHGPCLLAIPSQEKFNISKINIL